jgi:hypothetical protein
MKYLLLVPVAFLCCVAVKAQKPDMYKSKPWEDWKKKNLMSLELKSLGSDTLNGYSNQQQEKKEDPGVLRTPIQRKLLGLNDKGDRIYAMTPDNMPCLVPGKSFKSNMPVAGNKNRKNPTLLPLNKNDGLIPDKSKIIGKGDNYNW